MAIQLATSLRLSTSINFLEECGTCEDMDSRPNWTQAKLGCRQIRARHLRGTGIHNEDPRHQRPRGNVIPRKGADMINSQLPCSHRRGDPWGFAALSGHACGVKEMPHPIEIFSRRRCAGLIV